jgi:hypothetical protein
MYWQTLFLTAKAVLETPRTVWWVKFSEDSYLNKNKKLNTLLANYKASFRFKRSHYPANSFERKTTLKTDRFKNHTIVQFWKNDFFENFREKKTDENWRKLTKTDENWRKLTKTDLVAFFSASYPTFKFRLMREWLKCLLEERNAELSKVRLDQNFFFSSYLTWIG